MSGKTLSAHSWFVAAALVAVVALLGWPVQAAAQEEAGEKECPPGLVPHAMPHTGHLHAFQTAPHRAGGYLGVGIEDVDAEEARELGLPEVRGARVTDVAEDSPAAEAGLRSDDVIIVWNRRPVDSAAELQRRVRETPAGREVQVTLVRDRAERTLTVQVGERRRPAAAFRGVTPHFRHFSPEHSEEWRERMEEWRERMERRMEDVEGLRMEELERRMERMKDVKEEALQRRLDRARTALEELDLDELRERMERGELGMVGVRIRGAPAGRLGVRLQPLTDQLAEHFGVADEGGLLVASVREGSPGEEAGLRAGDVIVSVAGAEARRPGQVARAVREADPGPVEVTVVRDGQRRTLTVEVPVRERRQGTDA